MSEFKWDEALVKEYVKLLGVDPEHTYQLNQLEKFKESKQPKPLFEYNDFKIYKGDKFWYTNRHVWRTDEVVADETTVHGLLVINKYIPFKTEEEAKEWVILNKPVLSLNDFINLWGNENIKESPLINDIKKLVKSKL